MSNRSAWRASILAIGNWRSAALAVRGVVLAGLVAFLASCMRPSALWIVPGATLQALTFGLAQERGGTEPVESLQLVAVRTCYEADRSQAVLWHAGGLELTHGEAPTRIGYGVAPSGFRHVIGPERLEAGRCYAAYVSGAGISATVRFRGDSAGNVSEQK